MTLDQITAIMIDFADDIGTFDDLRDDVSRMGIDYAAYLLADNQLYGTLDQDDIALFLATL